MSQGQLKTRRSPANPTVNDETRLYSSWKEIANHFGRSIRTVQRWTREYGLPIYRSRKHDTRLVFARPHELDEWLLRSQAMATERADAIAHLRAEVKELRAQGQALNERTLKLHIEVERLARRCTG